ncbi:DNA replication complex GINS protein PSF2 [Zea mays]|nr:DNA replication complex GINS protein PSF2 [Zea mays]
MEVNIVRPFMVRTLQAFYKHDSAQMIQQADNIGSRATLVTDRGPRVSFPCSYGFNLLADSRRLLSPSKCESKMLRTK